MECKVSAGAEAPLYYNSHLPGLSNNDNILPDNSNGIAH